MLLAVALTVACGSTASAGSLSDYRLLVLDGQEVKWGAPVLGSGATVTYAVVPAERRFAGARNCAGIAPMDRLLAANGVARPLFDRELAAAFAAWSAVVNLTFARVDAASADILIGAETEPRGRAFTNVAYDHGPSAENPRQIGQSVICLNPSLPWKVGFDGDLEVYDLRYTLEHEIGHAIGLDHPVSLGELMGFRYLEQFRVPQPGDIEGAVALYGPPAAGAMVAAARPVAPGRAKPAAVQPFLAIGTPAPR